MISIFGNWMDSHLGIQIISSVCWSSLFSDQKHEIYKGLDHLLTYIKKGGGCLCDANFGIKVSSYAQEKKVSYFLFQFITCYCILIHFCKKFQNSTFHPKGGYWVRIKLLMYPYSITTYYICVMNIWDRTYKITII